MKKLKKISFMMLSMIMIFVFLFNTFAASAQIYSDSQIDLIYNDGTTTRAAWCYSYVYHNDTTKTATGYVELGYHSTIRNFPMYGYFKVAYGRGTTSTYVGYKDGSNVMLCTTREDNKLNFSQTISSTYVVHYARMIGDYNITHSPYSHVNGYGSMTVVSQILPVGW